MALMLRQHGGSMKFFLGLALFLLAEFHLGISAPTSTSLSGFGSRSVRKTIFPTKSNTTASLSTPQSIANAIFSQDLKIVTDQPKLWARRSRDPDILWFQTRDADGNVTKTFCISVLDKSGDWKVEERPYASSSSSDETQEWIPIEGIFGFYKLPSGIVWILITSTKPWYSAPPIHLNGTSESSWWQIRKVVNFELVHLSIPDMILSTVHLQEEVRQLRLLRQSLKEHGFYFVPPTQSSVVKDMTCHLQDSLEKYLNADREATSEWWNSEDHRPDPRFFWNQAAVEPILQRYAAETFNSDQHTLFSDLLQHVIPLTSAFVGVQSNVTDENTGLIYDQVLISRRSRFRAGTRFTRRGADASGAVANFAETEQVGLVLNGTNVKYVLSHLQTRGSIPLRWSSPADVKTYRPRVRIGTDPLAQARAVRFHLLDQFSHYVEPDDAKAISKGSNASQCAKLIFVNLVDKKKDQGRLGRAFDSVLKAVVDVYAVAQEPKEELPPRLYDLYKAPKPAKAQPKKNIEEELLGNPANVEHIWYDFHAEVKNGRWDRLTKLLGELQPALDNHNYFLAAAPNATSSWTIQRKQRGIVRTNCMDCLDRTNVIQSLFGRYVLFRQLYELATESAVNETRSTWEAYSNEFTNVDPPTIPWESGEIAHRLLWADNADAISRLYAGTPALKGDFTRTGQRTKRGALDDGVNSLQRYYLNNFLDADRQEGIDLLVGYAGFSNVDETDHDAWVSSNNGGEKTKEEETEYMSIKQAARENFFGRLISRMDQEEIVEIQEQLGVLKQDDESVESAMEQQYPGVDLRWLPGDLQSHMMSNADLLLAEDSSSSDDNNRGTISFEFSSIKALADIDRRSASDLPWWACVVGDEESSEGTIKGSMIDTGDSSDSDEDSSVVDSSLVLPDYQRLPRLERSQVLAILLFGVRSPTSLAAILVSLLGLIFLPAVIQHDFLNR